MSILINLIIFLIILIIVWKIVEYAFSAFGTPLSGQVKNLIGLIFLLIFLIQVAALFGHGTPVIFYR